MTNCSRRGPAERDERAALCDSLATERGHWAITKGDMSAFDLATRYDVVACLFIRLSD
jgi:hypothetical protein